jgi:hypothetical protein
MMQLRSAPFFLALGILFAITLLCGNARADTFVIDGSTSPMTMQYYTPPGGGHYVCPESCEWIDSISVNSYIPGVQSLALGYGIGSVPQDPNSPPAVPCQYNIQAGCTLNVPDYYLPDGTNLGDPKNEGAALYSTSGDLLWVIVPFCGGDICGIQFFAGIGGSPISGAGIDALDLFISNAHDIVTDGGLQDVFDIVNYDGTNDHIEVVVATPEPSCLILLATVLLGSAAFARRENRQGAPR